MSKKLYVVYEIGERYSGDKRRAYDEAYQHYFWREWWSTEDWAEIELWKSGKLAAVFDENSNPIEYMEVPDVYKIECHEVVEQVGECISPAALFWEECQKKIIAKETAE